MNVGMMWFNDNPKTPLATKVKEAAEYYLTKYGRKPDLCMVNPGMVNGSELSQVDGITVRVLKSVLPGHLWIGVDDKGANDGNQN